MDIPTVRGKSIEASNLPQIWFGWVTEMEKSSPQFTPLSSFPEDSNSQLALIQQPKGSSKEVTFNMLCILQIIWCEAQNIQTQSCLNLLSKFTRFPTSVFPIQFCCSLSIFLNGYFCQKQVSISVTTNFAKISDQTQNLSIWIISDDVWSHYIINSNMTFTQEGCRAVIMRDKWLRRFNNHTVFGRSKTDTV